MAAVVIAPPERSGGAPWVLRAPASKSEVLRALVAAAVGGGGTVEGIRAPWPEDVSVMVTALETLGARVRREAERVTVLERPVGGGGPVTVHAGEGAAPARFLITLGAWTGRPVTVTGSGRLPDRPLGGLLRALEDLGVRIVGGPGLPVTVRGPLRGGGAVRVDTGATSQFASALLLVAPGVSGGLRLVVAEGGVSGPYIDLTRDVMGRFGASVGPDLAVGPEVAYRPDAVVPVAPDWSGAGVLLAAAAFLGSPVWVPDLALASPQPDRGIVPHLEALGLSVVPHGTGVLACGSVTAGATMDLRGLPDAAPALAALAVLSPEPCRIVGAPHLRDKESDRIGGLVALLRAVGVDAHERPDGLEVHPSSGSRTPTPRDPLAPVDLDVRGDHRLAMAGALLGLWRPVRIGEAAVVAKSFPDFFDQWPGTRE